jgi:hypothetical protein
VPPRDGEADPIRSTLVAILQQLNRAESINEGRARDQSLELKDVERLLEEFWAVRRGEVRVPLALGLLVRNGLVEGTLAERATRDGPGPRVALYRITAEGKAFLVSAQQNSDRIP